jgi:SH3 domain protein
MIRRFAMPLQLCLLFCLLFLSVLSQAQSRYVSDVFEVTMRSGPTGSHTILRMLNSGTSLEVLERDADTGYSRVRTAGGTEGWVLSRYLMAEPAARNQLEILSGELTNATNKGDSTSAQVSAIKNVLDSATKRTASLEDDNERLQIELEEIKNIAANVLAIDEQNKALRERLTDNEAKMGALLQENHELGSQKEKDWFIVGALVLFAGLVTGLLVTRIRWHKRSRYDDDF